ncbi:MAG TPA: sodium:solute symporter family protein [Terriglobia bacterium]|nr:sodium:solute symporter family protein [Terriglobia bacterium]
MKITLGGWLMVAAYFLFNLLIGLYFRKKGTESTNDYFVSGRNVSWWLAGTSMVAATFSADTPLAVTGLVATQGIAGNWLWWGLLLSGMMTVFCFARLWRRAEIVTDVEFVELRYSGKPAAFLRGFRALYFGVLMNCLILGWVNLAMEKILMTVLGVSESWALAIIFAIIAFTGFYTFISGLWGVLWTDFFQFILKMSMVIVLACYGVRAVGGMKSLFAKLAVVDAARRAAHHGGAGSILSFIPSFSSPWMPFVTFFVCVGVNWWANWYPGAAPGGDGYIAQRIFSAKDEKHSLWATLWFNIAQYAIRPWPWIVTALVSVALYPHLQDPEIGYVKVWVDHLPQALGGLMLAAFAAAYMSTIATQLNWGSSYLINDLYRRFMVKGRNEAHYVTMSQMATVLLALAGAAVSLIMTSVAGAWQLLLAIGAGTGTVYLLRWYWWRINAWSEISSMAAALLTTVALHAGFHLSDSTPRGFAESVLITVAVTSAIWLAVTFLTAPEPEDKLLEFYRRVRPSAAGWQHIAALATGMTPARDGWRNIGDWLLGSAMVYLAMFGVGRLILGPHWVGCIYLLVSAACGYAIYWDFSRRGWETFSGRK